jgi:hypothetical protein
LFDRIFEMLILSRELVEISDGHKKELIKIGIFKHQSSMITVKGNELENSNQSKIQINYGITWFMAINFLMLGVIIFMFAYLLSNDIWGWIIGLSIFIIESLYCVIELNKTRE